MRTPNMKTSISDIIAYILAVMTGLLIIISLALITLSAEIYSQKGDMNGDGVKNIIDLSILADQINKEK